MGIQELIVLLLVLAAATFSIRGFVRQFTRGNDETPKCTKCELGRAVLQQNEKR